MVHPDTNIGAAIGGALGKFAGDRLGLGSAGQWIGSKLGGGLVTLIKGHGAYEVSENTILKSGGVLPEGAPPPAFLSGHSEVRVAHEETIFVVVAPATPAAFTMYTFPLTPLILRWLARYCCLYQKWRARGWTFTFVSTSSGLTSTTALGEVAMVATYDPYLPPFTCLEDLLGTVGAVSEKPSVNQICAVECATSLTPTGQLYVDSIGAVDDDRFTQLGTLTIATTGLTATAGTILGRIVASVDMEFFDPVLSPDANIPWVAYFAFTTGVTKNAPFGTSGIPDAELGMTRIYDFDTAADEMWIHANGVFLVQFFLTGTTLVAPTFALTSATNSKFTALWQGSGVAGGYGTQQMFQYLVRAADPVTRLKLTTTASATITEVDVAVSPVPHYYGNLEGAY
jgi:hypothetical protein